MDTKILEKLVKDHIHFYPAGYFGEDKAQHLAQLAEQCQKRVTELEQVRQDSFELFMEVLQLRAIELYNFANLPNTPWRNIEMTQAAATLEYLQRIAFEKDIGDYYREESLSLFQEAERKAESQLEEWQAQNHLLLNSSDKEDLQELKKEAIRSHQGWGKLSYNRANKERVIKRLSFLLFGIDTGQDRTPEGVYITKLSFSIRDALKVEYLNRLISGKKAKGKAEPEHPASGTPENPTQWQLAAYYHYLKDKYPTPFDNHRTQKEAFEEITKRHSKYGGRSPGGFKVQWVESSYKKRTAPDKLKDLRVVLEMLRDYPKAAAQCRDEIRIAEKR
mgnify:CR=1 FL=1